MANGLAVAGLGERAERVARDIPDPGQRARALVEVASVLAQVGLFERAGSMAQEAEQIARAIAGPEQQVSAGTGVQNSVA